MAKKVIRKPKTFAFRFLFFGVFSIVIIATILGSLSRVWISILDKYREKDKLEEKLTLLQEEGDSLSIDVEKLQDPEYQARWLKEKFFYSSDGEYIIRLPHVDSEK